MDMKDSITIIVSFEPCGICVDILEFREFHRYRSESI